MKLSIITINYNDAIGLKKTIDSVIHQSYTDFEYIIIDGGSTDGSLDIIKENESHISYWVSEPDKGIYNAMNKGILVAKGEYLLFLNGGDWFCNKEVLVKLATDTNDYDIIYGDQYCHFPDGRITEDIFPDVITFHYLAYQNSLPHQATLIKRIFLVEHGLYDETMKMNADWKFFMLSVFKWHCKYIHKSGFIVNFKKDGISSDPNQFHLRKLEKDPVMLNEFSNFTLYKDEMDEISKLEFYYKYSRIIRIIKIFGLIKKFSY
jgi:glycosyltransferase involved in cell wall biosynthesis